MNFDTAFDRLIGHEGGYVNHPQDPGGETNWGITIKVARANGYTGPMRLMTRQQAKAIYNAAYWNPIKASQIPFAIAFQLFDASVNHGVTQAVKFLQRVVGVADDGVMGPITLGAVRAHLITDVILKFNAQRLSFFTQLESWPTFGKGHTRRVAENLRYAAADT